MRRAAIPVALSLLLVLSGCIGGGATPDARTTESTTSGPTTAGPATDGAPADGTTTPDPATTRAPAESAYPPGVTADGVVNLSALLEAHAGRLADAGFALRTAYESAGDDGGRVVRDVTAAPGLGPAYAEVDQGRNRPNAGIWANETLLLSRVDADGEVRYHGRERTAGEDRHTGASTTFTGVNRLDRVLSGAELAVADETRVDGRRQVTLRTTGGDGVNATLVVDADGVVRSASVAGSQDGREFTFEYDLRRLGVDSVEPPAWLADAPEIVDPDLDFRMENCTDTYLELDHGGGDALPAGSTVTVGIGNETHSVVLDGALANGTRYLYLDEGGTLRLTDSTPPADRGSVGNEVDVGVSTAGGYQVLNAGMGFGCESATADGSAGESSGSGSSSSGSSASAGSPPA